MTRVRWWWWVHADLRVSRVRVSVGQMCLDGIPECGLGAVPNPYGHPLFPAVTDDIKTAQDKIKILADFNPAQVAVACEIHGNDCKNKPTEAYLQIGVD